MVRPACPAGAIVAGARGDREWLWLVGSAASSHSYSARCRNLPAGPQGMLAYSTISHLGSSRFHRARLPARPVAAISTHEHAIFKASLFMAAGIIDHESGTRDIGDSEGSGASCRSPRAWPGCRAAMAGVPLLTGPVQGDVLRRDDRDSRHSMRSIAHPRRNGGQHVHRRLFAALHRDVFFGPLRRTCRARRASRRLMLLPAEILV